MAEWRAAIAFEGNPMGGEGLPVFVINLDTAKARLERISRELHARGIAFERVEAVDGRKLANPARFVSPLSRLLRVTALSAGEIGCWLSHRRVWERIVVERTPRALVLEDDASPRVASDELDAVDPGRLGLDLIRLHILKQETALLPKQAVRTGRFIADRELSFVRKPKYSATAYVVTLEGARKLLSRRRMLAPVDWFTLWSAFDGLRHGVLLPNMFEAEDDGESTIGDRTLVGLPSLHERFVRRHVIRRLDRRHARQLAAELESCGAISYPMSEAGYERA